MDCFVQGGCFAQCHTRYSSSWFVSKLHNIGTIGYHWLVCFASSPLQPSQMFLAFSGSNWMVQFGDVTHYCYAVWTKTQLHTEQIIQGIGTFHENVIERFAVKLQTWIPYDAHRCWRGVLLVDFVMRAVENWTNKLLHLFLGYYFDGFSIDFILEDFVVFLNYIWWLHKPLLCTKSESIHLGFVVIKNRWINLVWIWGCPPFLNGTQF